MVIASRHEQHVLCEAKVQEIQYISFIFKKIYLDYTFSVFIRDVIGNNIIILSRKLITIYPSIQIRTEVIIVNGSACH